MRQVRSASTRWEGGLADGSGETRFASGALGPVRVSWPRRTEDPEGATSPEELVAAAHASCFAMAFSHELGQRGATGIQLQVDADVTIEDVPDGVGVTTSALRVRGHADGVDEAGFMEAAEAARTGCPISRALAGVEISLDASVD
jgi:osmotically inducible protein OsmC